MRDSHVQLCKHYFVHSQSICIYSEWLDGDNCFHIGFTTRFVVWADFVVHRSFNAKIESLSLSYWQEAEATIG